MQDKMFALIKKWEESGKTKKQFSQETGSNIRLYVLDEKVSSVFRSG
jgi:mevalonate pyrophosphate decarboxylase